MQNLDRAAAAGTGDADAETAHLRLDRSRDLGATAGGSLSVTARLRPGAAGASARTHSAVPKPKRDRLQRGARRSARAHGRRTNGQERARRRWSEFYLSEDRFPGAELMLNKRVLSVVGLRRERCRPFGCLSGRARLAVLPASLAGCARQAARPDRSTMPVYADDQRFERSNRSRSALYPVACRERELSIPRHPHSTLADCARERWPR